MKNAMVRIVPLLVVFVSSQDWVAGQKVQDVPSASPSPSALQSLPLDSTHRASLEEAIKTRDYAHAETLLLEEISRNRKSAPLLTLLGRVLFLDGKYLNSAIALKKAAAMAPLDDQNRFTLAMAYITLDHKDWARPELEKLARSDPRNVLYPYWLSRLDYDAMQFTSAVANAQKALALDPGFTKAYDNLGLCYDALGRYDEAIHAYKEAIRLDRQKTLSSPWPPLNLGTLLIKLDRLEEAEAYLRGSLRYDPRFPKAHFQLGLLLEKQKKDTEAIRELHQAAAFDPLYPEPHYVLAAIYRRKGDAKKAHTEWSTFQELKIKEKEIGRRRSH